MADLLLKLVSTTTAWSRSWTRRDPSSAPVEHKIGKYHADYSRLTPEEIAQADDDELAELYGNSRPVSR